MTAAVYAFLAGLMTREALIWARHHIDGRRYTATDAARDAADQWALRQLADRYPVAYTHLLDEAMAAAGIPTVPSPPHTADTTDERRAS